LGLDVPQYLFARVRAGLRALVGVVIALFVYQRMRLSTALFMGFTLMRLSVVDNAGFVLVYVLLVIYNIGFVLVRALLAVDNTDMESFGISV
jgi:hypothetical protein